MTSPGSATKILVLYRDGHYLAAHKPIGIPTYQESRGQGALGLKELLEEQLSERFFPVHRIDLDTSGVVLFALNSKAASELVRLFKEHRVQKTYVAWCVGTLPENGSITRGLKKHKSDLVESARTDYVRIKISNGFSLARISPRTGRFHQIRRHFDSIGHALVGDSKYGKKALWANFFKTEPRLMLQAEAIEFVHPVTKRAVKVQTKVALG